ncbi:SGNH/GDSL hydrolase family protein [Yinghuangia sp. ASG 101]|uniref:SGNH/GDSL hydrolase family protein n=1 Tax=Yinghuangia sp. ASG 101 TaxID=2896848 RepID=UPI001E456E84|nr:SGNH/GDSL hydrolase family protein [Yinghuangia sp. ASG 101]UGQ12607.1 SGNH/GDSL hydrolase family protein [Yinghuangia sp. ASG 101]
MTTPADASAPSRPAAGPFRSYVAVGDSFTEGMSDPYPPATHPHGAYRGWADLLADRLAEADPGLRYANLAVRGKLIRQIADDQVPTAAAFGADLASFAGGLNDVLRPRCDLGAVRAALEESAAALAAAGGHLVLFRTADPTRRLKSSARLMPRIEQLIAYVDDLGARHHATVVDLFTVRAFDDPRLWAADRLHLSADGHARVAEAVCEALGLPHDAAWRTPLPAAAPAPWLARRRDDARWAKAHLGPWLYRRATGRSSGDDRAPKHPDLAPWPTVSRAGPDAAPRPARPSPDA